MNPPTPSSGKPWTLENKLIEVKKFIAALEELGRIKGKVYRDAIACRELIKKQIEDANPPRREPIR